MKKLLASIIVLLTVFTSVFGYTGLMAGEKDLRVSKTTWFDIIYPARSEKAAILLYENADRIYEEIGKTYGSEPKFRMPVVICPSVEKFNGYFSTSPANHIVLYDTAMIEDLAVFTDTFLNLFKHECIHAYTFNMKDETWTTVANIFGDPINLSTLILTQGLIEGATVSGESAGGEGRLNDSYATQMVKQAKIEDKFPKFYDVQGASDIYPVGSFYYFNGAFNQWLQQKYGMEKYAEYWYGCVNAEHFSQKRIFKEAYNIKILDAWEDFKKEYAVPEIAANPVEAGLVKDFFDAEQTEKYSSYNNSGALYSHLSSSEKGLAYLDESCGNVYYISFEDLEMQNKPVKLLHDSYIFDIDFSKDGNFLVIGKYDLSGKNVRTVTQVYNLETKKTYTLKDHGYYEPSIVKTGNDYYVIRQGYETPEYTICVDKLIFDQKGTVTDSAQVSKKTLPLNVAPFSFTDLGNGTVAYIKKAGLEYSIEVMDLEQNKVASYKAPKERMTIRYLSCDGEKLLFSWATAQTMPRLGSLNLAKGSFSLQQDDISGGVYYPVAVPKNNQITYIGNFYRQNRLLTREPMEDAKISQENSVAVTEGSENQTSTDTILASQQTAEDAPVGIQPQLTSIPYEPFKYMPFYKNGIFIPMSAITSVSYSPDFQSSYPLMLGCSYMTNTPWDSGYIELDAGYGLSTETFGLELTTTGSNGCGTFSYSAVLETEFNFDGWKKGLLDASVTKYFPVGKNSLLFATPAAYLYYGKSDCTPVSTGDDLLDTYSYFLPGTAVSEDKSFYGLYNLSTSFGYSNIHSAGFGKYEQAGFQIAGNLYYQLWNNPLKHTTYYNGMDIGLYSLVYIPKLIPIDCPSEMSYNLPAHLLCYLFPSSVTSGMFGSSSYTWAADVFKTSLPVATIGVETLLFGCDIQTSSFIHWLYFNDFQITAGYAGLFVENTLGYQSFRFLYPNEYVEKIANNQIHYEDYLNIRLSVNLVPAIGQLGNYSNKFSLYCELGIAGLAGKHSSASPILTVGIGSSRF